MPKLVDDDLNYGLIRIYLVNSFSPNIYEHSSTPDTVLLPLTLKVMQAIIYVL